MKALCTLIACAALLSGCGLRNPYSPGAGAPAEPTRPTAPARTAASPPPTETVASATGVLGEFATVYSNFSPSSATWRVQMLTSLATAQLAAALRQGAAQAELDAVRELPSGAELSGRVMSLQLRPGARTQRGVVVVQQALTSEGEALDSPFTTVFLATVAREMGGWRVAAFTPTP